MCNETLFNIEKVLPPAGLKPGTFISAGQGLTYRATKVPETEETAEGLGIESMYTLKCLGFGTPKTFNFPFVPNGKLMVCRSPDI